MFNNNKIKTLPTKRYVFQTAIKAKAVTTMMEGAKAE
jgi:hypothetical protein